MVEERIGENMGPIDWDFDFSQGFANMCTSNETYRRERIERAKADMRTMEEAFRAGKRVRVTRSSNYTYDVLDVGMYDGWPYWRPTPAFLCSSPLGGAGDWSFYYDIHGVEVLPV
jgi:hypothetical protein